MHDCCEAPLPPISYPRRCARRVSSPFLVAVAQLVADLRAGTGFRRGLRVKKMQGFDDVWELTWGPDGRATFHYGESIKEGEPHIVWRRIGTHSEFTRP